MDRNITERTWTLQQQWQVPEEIPRICIRMGTEGLSLWPGGGYHSAADSTLGAMDGTGRLSLLVWEAAVLLRDFLLGILPVGDRKLSYGLLVKRFDTLWKAATLCGRLGIS
jgi:hypothetical protein